MNVILKQHTLPVLQIHLSSLIIFHYRQRSFRHGQPHEICFVTAPSGHWPPSCQGSIVISFVKYWVRVLKKKAAVLWPGCGMAQS